eukprot:TRINITY_DN77141_c0_g1_i1.p1 TRINITY_DN77141_c0_g1~~TRINITY_DN77141_c0_g1_i1.p1  ORF type:complete len:194 (+),score=46.00 TRINITY_DN77141_c0_g1_i1:67-582(+)
MALPAMRAAMKSAAGRGTGKTAMKAMKAMKAMRVKKVAKGRMAKALVLRGSKEKTVSGLTSDMLMKNKRGKVVSKRASAAGSRRYRQIEGWVDALMAAREALNFRGFVAINGKSLQGKALYVKSKALYNAGRIAVSASSAEQSPTANRACGLVTESTPALAAPAAEDAIAM